MAVLERLGRGLKCAAIFPVGVFDPLQRGFVGAEEGIGYELVTQQIGVDHARHFGWMPRRWSGAGFFKPLAKFPAVVERNTSPLCVRHLRQKRHADRHQ